jgi:hypothetical protein
MRSIISFVLLFAVLAIIVPSIIASPICDGLSSSCFGSRRIFGDMPLSESPTSMFPPEVRYVFFSGSLDSVS